MPVPDYKPGDIIKTPKNRRRRFLGLWHSRGSSEPQAVYENIIPRTQNRNFSAEGYPAELGANEYTNHCNLSGFKAWARNGTVIPTEGEIAQLARFLYEEFDRDGWGDIEPFYFKMVADGDYDDDDNADQVDALKAVLKRVVARLEAA